LDYPVRIREIQVWDYYIRSMKRARYEARGVGWNVVRIDPDGKEFIEEVLPEAEAKARAKALNDEVKKASKTSGKKPRQPPR
jgi:hypothetical protein